MGRELKRVALDFKWPLHKVWKGFVNPHYGDCYTCEACNGTGLSAWARDFDNDWWGRGSFRPEDIGLNSLEPSHPEIMRQVRRHIEQSPEYYGTGDAAVEREAKRLASHYNRYRQNFLTQAEIDIVREAAGFSIAFFKVLNEDGSVSDRTEPLDPDFVTSTLISSIGIDINYTPILRAMEKEKGSYLCSACDGTTTWWSSEAEKAAAENWEPTEPPAGEGWQLWETVSEGSPISPVFATAEELARWLTAQDDNGLDGSTTYDQWMAFLQGPGWAPSMVISGGRVMSGVQAVTAA
jgi:hypothetical protein